MIGDRAGIGQGNVSLRSLMFAERQHELNAGRIRGKVSVISNLPKVGLIFADQYNAHRNGFAIEFERMYRKLSLVSEQACHSAGESC